MKTALGSDDLTIISIKKSVLRGGHYRDLNEFISISKDQDGCQDIANENVAITDFARELKRNLSHNLGQANLKQLALFYSGALQDYLAAGEDKKVKTQNVDGRKLNRSLAEEESPIISRTAVALALTHCDDRTLTKIEREYRSQSGKTKSPEDLPLDLTKFLSIATLEAAKTSKKSVGVRKVESEPKSEVTEEVKFIKSKQGKKGKKDDKKKGEGQNVQKREDERSQNEPEKPPCPYFNTVVFHTEGCRCRNKYITSERKHFDGKARQEKRDERKGESLKQVTESSSVYSALKLSEDDL
ncbi:Oidioi.mRNA.OKI2018_I69.YSR.g17175.t1.cds [Oikopleura dioica]|uniref:Oidioi.mRNA.OKI2018_I69.YSR.g17175.t1.cds n=1 Tax=Oikopleura dioica TaxID=34765 RepID=A0ABN7SML9_OIKDI|nr:Oidioi.mRNA.OKI2018_I69.YSR.g17175.t1.cds [Oikopleura dioica]